MCPEPLRKHLRPIGPETLVTYELMRAEIADWLADEFRRPVKQRAAALEQSGGDCDDTEWDRTYEAMDSIELMAVGPW